MNPHAFLSLENSFNRALTGAWKARAGDYAQDMADKLDAGSYTGAGAIAGTVSLTGLVSERRGAFEALAKSCILFGASGLAPIRETGFMTGALDTKLAVDGALSHLTTMVEIEGTKAAQWEALQQVQGRQYRDDEPIQLFKKESLSELAAKLNAATMGTGKALIDIGANQTTSRLIAFGFLSQAAHTKIDLYQVSEVLDDRTCPVCRYMHGKVFKVANELSTLKQAFQAQDAADLKSIKPWPKQSKAALASLYTSGPDQLQAAGYGSPPYHPACRGMLVPLGSVDEDIPPQIGVDMEKLQALFSAAKAKATGASVVETSPGRFAKVKVPPVKPTASGAAPMGTNPPNPPPVTLSITDMIDKLPNEGIRLVAKSLLAAGQLEALNQLLKKYGILP